MDDQPLKRYWPGFSRDNGAEGALADFTSTVSAFAGRCWLATMNWLPSTNHMKTTYIHQEREFITALTSCDVSFGDPPLSARGRGSSATRRAAIARGSEHDAGRSGKVLISAVILSIADSPGKSANLEASCHGSRSARANPERTLSDMPFVSSPIGANRKALNSESSTGTGRGRFIPATGFPARFQESEDHHALSALRVRFQKMIVRDRGQLRQGRKIPSRSRPRLGFINH